MTTELRIDQDRLYASLRALGAIGAYDDPDAGLKGVNRLALTDADGQGRRQVVAWMKEAGLEVTIDRIGNVYGRRSGLEDHLEPVMAGSHIDSVPTAGAFDGCLGVLGALEVVRTLNDAGRRTRRPLVVAFFTDEEGSRFGTDMLGSAVATGRIGLEEVWALRDLQGKTVREELERIGFLGEAPVDRVRPYAYLECHIEQGPSLRSRSRDIGVVTGVQAISWQQLTITGRSAHAGTTPMDLRHDAGVAASRINLRMRELTRDARFQGGLRTTMGAYVPTPGLVNIVPGRVVATVDLRHPDDALMALAEEELRAFYGQVEREEGVQIAWRQTAKTAAVNFHPRIQAMVAAAAAELELVHEPIMSGAGHDAQEWSRVCPTGMIFVPGEHLGISHNPREYSTPKQCGDGINVLLRVLLRLADEAPGVR